VHNQKSTAIWKSRTKKSVAVGVVAVVLAITVQFLVNYFSNELSKESHVDKQGAMVSTDGNVVKTQMEEMKVDADGKLLSRNGAAAVKTMPSLAKVALASSLPDATLMALEEITVHSDKGYTLQVKVHGFSRVPVLNSRCGNVVHFYTAWKGKVTLDSTDLSFDETTAAEFKNSGFSLATGGRRLAGGISVDGFAKALEGIRESGKWTCAGVPLPVGSTFSHSKLTKYQACGPKGDMRNDLCFSMYGGLKVGLSALEGSLAAAMTSQTERMKVRQTEKLFMKSSGTTMVTKSYSVSFDEYPMHPGQQLVSISNMASGRQVRFQMESDRTRSHCEVSKRKMQSDPYDWAFEYLGVNEEDGQVLRHFRARVLTLDGTDAIARSVIEFWDVAESMQPHRQISGGTEVVVYDSFKIVSDSDVEAAVETRTGKTIADLLKCNERDAYRESRPEMSLLDDLSETDAAYYKASSSTKSETFSRYLDATLDPKTMPDVCYEKCKSLLDAVKMAEISTDICDGPVEGALECLKQTGLQECLSSVFFESHANECDRQALDSNNTVRTLEESEDAMEELKAIEVLVNETPRKNRRLGHYTYNLPTNKDYWSSADRYRATVEELMPERTASGRYTHEKEVWDRLEKQQPGRGTGSNPLSSGAIRAINNQDVDWKHWCKTEGTDTQSYNYQRCWEITTCTTNYMWKFSVESEGERKGSPNEKVVRACCINAMDSTQKFFFQGNVLRLCKPTQKFKGEI